VYWERSLEIEAGRRQFDHDSEEGSGTLQMEHAVAVEDSAAATIVDGDQLESNVYSLDEYNDGRDPHSVAGGEKYKLDREHRFLKSRAESCATTAGLTGEDVQEVVRLVTSINSGAFTFYGPEREGGGQDAHIVAAIAYVGNKGVTDLDRRMESRETFQSVVTDVGMDQDDVRGAVRQLRKQLREERG
jgi:CheY-like chemotaxis protein